MKTVEFRRADGPAPRLFSHGITRPRVFDWNRDGKDDLVLGTREIHIDRNLRSFDVDKWLKTVEREKQAKLRHDFEAENNLRTTGATIPNFASLTSRSDPMPTGQGYVLRQGIPIFVEFSDWDRDGNFDLLAIIRSHFWSPGSAKVQVPVRRHTIFWLRNKTSTGEPEFDEPRPLYQVRHNIVLHSFTVIDWNDDGTNEIVAAAADVDPKNRTKLVNRRLELLARKTDS